MTVDIYTSDLAPEWDKVVKESRNGTFLHMRGYMDYHADRFEDMSLVARDDRGRIIALLPANRRDGILTSHGGLTYGGWLMTSHADMPAMMELWPRMMDFLHLHGISELRYKPVPHIYHRYPAEEDLYALWCYGGQIDSTLVSTVIDLACPLNFDMSARQNVRKAAKAGVRVGESDRWHDFWQILEQRLMSAHGARPVHTLDEIMLLQNRFPDNIRLFIAEQSGEIVGGVVIYFAGTVAHSQYTATTEEGRSLRCLPLLYRHIIDNLPAGTRYFDFGTSNEDAGRVLNGGLVRQKVSFGGRAVVYTSYTCRVMPTGTL